MLRRRILASAMASVMAIGSVAVVASAEDAATTQVKTKADLEAYVKTFDKFREDGIYDYGSKSGEKFLSAIEYADNVLANGKSTVDNYTVAYTMLESVYNNLKIYSAEELKTLIANCKSIYNTNNIMNEELQDLIYDEATFADFATKYEAALSYVSSNDSRIISDTYEDLADAKANLKNKTVVTKSQFRSALKNFETIITRSKDYDSWRRGTLPNGWVDGIANWWVFTNNGKAGATIDFETLLDYTIGEGYNIDHGSWAEEGIVKGGYARIDDFVNAAYDQFNEVKAANKTSDDTIVNGYNSAVAAYNLFNAWTADDTNRATKSSVTKLLDQYHAQLVGKYATTAAENLYINVNANWVESPAGSGNWINDVKIPNWTDAGNYYYGASLKNTTKQTTIKIDAKGYAHYNQWGPVEADYNGTMKNQSIAKGGDILKYIQVTSADVDDAALKNALVIAEKYDAGKYDATVYGLDETGKVSKAAGSAAEWTLVYRNLKYALEDTFQGKAAESHTKKEVSDLIEAAYDLAEKTGDASIFADEHAAMVEERQAALAWVREANKTKNYKDGMEVAGKTASVVYGELKGAYDTLDKKLAKYKYSYDDVYMTIADVKDKIDNGELSATETLVGLLNRTAYALSVVEAEELNEAFDGAREFQKLNRVRTDADTQTASEKELQAAYEALLAEVKAQAEPKVVLGDVNGDGVVNALDAAEVLKANVGLRDAIDVKVGDYNADGAVNALDAAAILKFVVGLA